MTRYPLTWPPGWRRIRASQRKRAQFNTKSDLASYQRKRSLTVSESVMRILDSLKLLGVGDWNTIISTNVQVRLDGLPRSGQAEPNDAGAAVYWKTKTGQQKVMAIDRYDRVADNLAAIAATLEAMRAIDRHGGAEILDRAFTGFVALPAPRDWREVLEIKDPVFLEGVKIQYRNLAQKRHPDLGGTAAAMAELNAAWAQAQTELA